MKPDSDGAMDDSRERDERDAIARLYREATHVLDERPDARVRAAVLAAAARAVDAKPHDAARRVVAHRYAARRWPLAAAALVVVSIMTGLVATHGWWERPDLVDANRVRSEAPIVDRSAAEPAPTIAQDEPRKSDPLNPGRQKAESTRQAARSAGAIESESRAADKSKSTRRESVRKPVPAARNAPTKSAATTHESPSASASASAPAATAPPAQDVAVEPRSNTAQAKSEKRSSDATPAPALAPPSIAQRSFSQGAEGRARMDARNWADAAPASPEAWVARIVKLRTAGDDDDADREVARLKQRFPDFTIPPEALSRMGTR